MGDAIPIGRIAGIAVRVHWSVLVIGGLIAWSLATVTLPVDAPHASDGARWAAATISVVVFWFTLLAHELAHSVVAQRRGIAVDSITLWLLGGVSRLDVEAGTPQTELRIAVAGPATSVALAVTAGTIAVLLSTMGASDLVVASVTWLALINGVLAVFNLVPAAPLDGGRILHAVWWKRTGDRHRATIVATTAGRAFGYLLAGLGVLVALAGAPSGLWFVVLGWFLLGAARAEATHVLLRDALTGVTIGDVMSADPITVPAHVTVDAALDEYFLRRHCSAFPVVDEHGAVVGLVTLRRIKEVPSDRRAVLTMREVAWPRAQVPTTGPKEQVLDVLERISASGDGDGRVLVFDEQRLVGIVSPTDINRVIQLAGLRHPPADGAVQV